MAEFDELYQAAESVADDDEFKDLFKQADEVLAKQKPPEPQVQAPPQSNPFLGPLAPPDTSDIKIGQPAVESTPGQTAAIQRAFGVRPAETVQPGTLDAKTINKYDDAYYDPLAPFVPFGETTMALKRADALSRIKRNFDAGTQTPLDQEALAYFQQRKPEEVAKTFGAQFLHGLTRLPAAVGEFALGGLTGQLALAGGANALESEAQGASGSDIAKQFGQHALTNAAFGVAGIPGLQGSRTATQVFSGAAKPYLAVQAAKELGAGLGLNPEGGLPTALRAGDQGRINANLAEAALFGTAEGVSAIAKAPFQPKNPFAKPLERTESTNSTSNNVEQPSPVIPENPFVRPTESKTEPAVAEIQRIDDMAKVAGTPPGADLGAGNPPWTVQEGEIPVSGVMPSAERHTSGVPTVDFKPPARSIIDGLKSAFAPSTRGPEARETAGIMRQNFAEMARDQEIAKAELARGGRILEKQIADLPDPAQRTAKFTEFTDAIEHGRIDTLPDDVKPIAKTIRELTDQRTQDIKDRGILKTFIEDYMGHIWKQGGKSPEDIGREFSRRPLAGSEAFKKQRSIPTFGEGIALGLEPQSWNPVELALAKLNQMDKSIMAYDIGKELKDRGMMPFVRLSQRAPDGFMVPKDKMFTKFFMPEEGPGPVLAGNYYVPETVAKLIDNHLSPTLRGNRAFEAFREAGNTLNQMQLGFSLFHLGFVTMDTQVSAASLALQRAAHGDVLGALKKLPEAVIPGVAPFRAMIQGSKVLREYYKPGSQGAAMADALDTMMKGGARAKMDTFYQASNLEQFRQNLKEAMSGDIPSMGKALVGALPAVSEFLSKPVMEGVVPRMKASVMLDLMQEEIGRTGATSLQEQRAAAGRAWDSVENRLGQMTYDNIFWNRMLKDGLMASVRSVGWNLGTVRELGGGIVDVPSSMKSLVRGKGISPRLAYVAALPVITAIYGAMYQYLATGKGPEELKDYFFPKTGRTRKDGTPDRVSLPSYMRDVAAISNRAGEGPFRIAQNAWSMAKHKTSPVLGLVADMLDNEDFFGKAIVDPATGAKQQAVDYGKHLAGGFIPFAARNVQQQKETGADTGQAIQGFFGITPAPAYIARSDEQQRAKESLASSFQTPLEKLRREKYGKFTPLMDKLGAMGLDPREFESVGSMATDGGGIPTDLNPETRKAIDDFLKIQARHVNTAEPELKLGETTQRFQERVAAWQKQRSDSLDMLQKAGRR